MEDRHESRGFGVIGQARIGQNGARWLRPFALVLMLILAAPGCSSRSGPAAWGASVERVGLESIDSSAPEDAGFETLQPLARLFYERITNRRFNSKATYDDPALREYFHSVSAFSDYYASVSEVLDRAHFQDDRPTASRLLRVERTGPGRALLRVSLVGANAQPMRWWNTRVVREDRWEYTDGRWWVLPGKV